jgi:hypothetical protein
VHDLFAARLCFDALKLFCFQPPGLHQAPALIQPLDACGLPEEDHDL